MRRFKTKEEFNTTEECFYTYSGEVGSRYSDGKYHVVEEFWGKPVSVASHHILESWMYVDEGEPNELKIGEPVDRSELKFKLETLEKASKNDKKDVKPDYSFVYSGLMNDVSFAMMAGKIKYGEWNYIKGHKVRQLTAAATRHLKAIENGEWWDEDTSNKLKEEFGEPAPKVSHLGCVVACMNMMKHQFDLDTLTDDTFAKIQAITEKRRNKNGNCDKIRKGE